MTARSSLDARSVAFTALPSAEDSLPLGTAYLPDARLGLDLATVGYREHEFLVSGLASLWTYDADGTAIPRRDAVPYMTRVLVRAPDASSGSGSALIAEPLHREYDSAPTWRTAGDWIVRTRATWVGITQDPYAANSMRAELDPVRYGRLSIPAAGLGFDIVGQVVGTLRTGALPDVLPIDAADRALLSGWSMTGSFCRAFLGDGFHGRHRLPDGGPVFDGYLVGISSGAAGRAGYPPLSEPASPPPVGDPRRTIGRHDVPVIELLSEFESETHGPCLRPDADEPDDRYRLYQVAGTSHAGFGGWSGATNREQYRRRGLPVPAREINERPSDARGEVVARAVFDLLDRWATTGEAPPRVGRFELEDRPPERPNPTGDARALRRDEFGNVVGGIRTPWVDVPVASYAPHSTPKPGSCLPAPGAPTGDAEHVASLLGNMEPLPEATLRDLYGSRREYLARYGESCRRLLAEGLLLEPDLDLLLDQAQGRVLPLP
jgi:Alpha/beta hydrolase domain